MNTKPRNPVKTYDAIVVGKPHVPTVESKDGDKPTIKTKPRGNK